MPKSNSDADENDSLTSDDEAVGPTTGRVTAGDVAPVKSRPSYANERESGAAGIEGLNETGASELRPPARPNAKFKASVNKVIAMRRAHAALVDVAPGTEPGADPRKSSTAEMYGHISAPCKIEISEYGPSKARFATYDNKGFIDWVNKPAATAKREIWNKVRWINIAGVSYDVISAIALRYELHPLSVEDILHGRKNARSKADYYTRHLFIHALTHTLGKDEDEPNEQEQFTRTEEPRSIPSSRTSTSVGKGYDSGDEGDSERQSGGWLRRRRKPTHASTLPGSDAWYDGKDLEQHAGMGTERKKPLIRHSLTPAGRAKAANQKAIDELKKGFGRVYVDVASAWIFLMRDGTIISISQKLETPFGVAISNRLRVRDTVLRSSGDASLLLESLLDIVVDNAVQVVDKYHDVILKMERSILLKPNMKTVRGLHIISGDLTLHKRTLGPLSQLVYGLRRYDLDRCKALASSASREGEVVGYLSHQAKVYLADVHDHVEYIMSSLDMFTSVSENLINYTFNIVSYETNQVMRGLTIATVIFFPLTFLTGYFGMNFEVMPSVKDHSEAMFWEIACPVMVVVVAAFLFPDIQRLIHLIKKRAATRKFDGGI
ncbi:CorA-like magnesium transporter protein [Ceratobasidium sp. AG-Ba]|nr:CorA-like magnesium transporter protein [Ceratobasidium sp. AG-Ba]